MIRTSYSVSIFLAWLEAGVGNQSMIRPNAMPSADAIAPMMIIWAMEACPFGRTSSGDLVLAPSRVVSSSAMGPGEYASRPMDGNAGRSHARSAAAQAAAERAGTSVRVKRCVERKADGAAP